MTQTSRQIQRPAVERAPTEQTAGRKQSAEVDQERVRRRAYEIYEARRSTGRDGNPIVDWLQAEREFSARDHA